MRPRLKRLVSFLPRVNYFKPAGVPLRQLEEINITVEELEALRLKDIEGLDQEKASKKMNVSRVTFQRILKDAHKKIARALVSGSALRIEGGSFILEKESKRK